MEVVTGAYIGEYSCGVVMEVEKGLGFPVEDTELLFFQPLSLPDLIE
jgi:hypothetical protein